MGLGGILVFAGELDPGDVAGMRKWRLAEDHREGPEDRGMMRKGVKGFQVLDLTVYFHIRVLGFNTSGVGAPDRTEGVGALSDPPVRGADLDDLAAQIENRLCGDQMPQIKETIALGLLPQPLGVIERAGGVLERLRLDGGGLRC
jgi:hypothetical protein